MSRAFVIVNPASGHYRPDTIVAAIERAAVAGARELEFREISTGESVSDIIRAAAARGFDMFVAVGGDGTVSGVVEGLDGSTVPVAIVPTGTGNLLARGLDIPLDPVAAAGLIAGEHATRTIDAMRVGTRVFVLNIGVGISSATVRDTSNADKRRFGRAAYVGTGLREMLGFRPCRFTVTVDGRTTRVRATEITVANCNFIGDIRWPLPLVPEILPDDGKLDVCLVLVPTAGESIRSGLRAMRHRRKPVPNVRWLRARRSVKIEANRVLPVQGDGDLIGETPVEVTALPQSVRVIVPRG
ncbi:diacylglycerol kinase family lipid kinase [bacterium]|nr:diacylglycerol kinase family lipid kinase [bacterium]